MPTLHSSNFTRDVPKETLSQEKYATNIPPSVRCTSITIGRTYTVAEYGNVLQRKKKEALYHYQMSNLKHEDGQLPKESHGYRDNDLIFFKKGNGYNIFIYPRNTR